MILHDIFIVDFFLEKVMVNKFLFVSLWRINIILFKIKYIMKLRLIIMNFLQFAVWGAYLTSMGSYLGPNGLGAHIGLFYSVQGLVSLFMPALMGIIADRWVPAQKLLGICHAVSGAALVAAGFYGVSAGSTPDFTILFTLYTIGVAFYMPTLALSNSVAYTALDTAGLDTVKNFPPIRVFGTVGFICSMWAVDLLGYQPTSLQFTMSGIIGLVLAVYSFSLPACPTSGTVKSQSMMEMLGLQAFALFRQKKMAIFFIFSFLLGASLQITNGFANPFIASFESIPEFATTFGVQHANILISLSQVSETLCILLVPFFLTRFGIKNVMLMSMFAWVLRFALFGLGDPGQGVWLFVLSMIVYGMAFDFFNISGSLYVDKEVDHSMRSSAQGLFMLMTNGFGAVIGTLTAQWIVNIYCSWSDVVVDAETKSLLIGDWTTVWYIFAAYSLVVAIAFALVFKYKHDRNSIGEIKH